MSSKGRTELQISLSGAKNVKEAAGDARFCVAPQKTCENIKKPIFFPEKNSRKFSKTNLGCQFFFFNWESFETRFGKVLMEQLRENSRKLRENSRIACLLTRCLRTRFSRTRFSQKGFPSSNFSYLQMKTKTMMQAVETVRGVRGAPV